LCPNPRARPQGSTGSRIVQQVDPACPVSSPVGPPQAFVKDSRGRACSDGSASHSGAPLLHCANQGSSLEGFSGKCDQLVQKL